MRQHPPVACRRRPHETGICLKTKSDKPLCDKGLVAALDALAKGANLSHWLLFVEDEETAAAWLA